VKRYKIGIDVGGTFTDGVLLDDQSGLTVNIKVPSTPKDPSVGFLENLDRLLREGDMAAGQTRLLVHGTTVATNSIIEGKTAKTAFITTGGFRDLLEIQFQIRPKLYDVYVEKPVPLVPRYLCYEVKERIGPKGEVLEVLDEEQVRKVALRIRQLGVESVAVCLLHAYINDSHERKIEQILAQECPRLPVTLSSRLCPTFREYPRASTTTVNACIVPVMGRYIERIEQGLRDREFECEWYLMQSNGGVLRSDVAALEPCRVIESGPAAGVIVSAYIAKLLGKSRALCIDIGGTTAKIGMIQDGTPMISSELEVGAAAFSRSTARRASGYPLRTPSIDLVEIGAGGGSIAWIDSGGILRVGPQSAGADPGPACYSAGGSQPTITDANLVLGRLNPAYFIGGAMPLSVEAAAKAIREKCAEKLGLGVLETAAGIIDVAVSNMVNAIRFISVERGYDPREFCLITTGGAGPLHSNLIAAELGIPLVVIQPSPGVASALGLLLTDIKQEASRTVINMPQHDWDMIRSIIEELGEAVRAQLREQDAKDEQIEFHPVVEMRYTGQSYELSVPVEWSGLESYGWERLREGFDREHERAYGFRVKEEDVVAVNIKVTGVGKMPGHRVKRIDCGTKKPKQCACNGKRNVYFAQSGGMTDCPVWNRYKLLGGNEIVGPAIIEEIDSTTVVLPGCVCRVDEFGNLLIRPN
jgi:N-methylhydantoinase A